MDDATQALQMTLASLRESNRPPVTVDAGEPLSSVLERFEQNPRCFGVLLTDGPRFLHLIPREWLEAHLARPNARELFLRKPVHHILRRFPLETLELPDTATISEAIELALWRTESEHYHPMAVACADGTRWLLNVKDLLLKQCRILSSTLTELEIQRQATDVAEADRRALQQRLLTASRDAGRAEIATGILHDVGNVLNSINVATSMLGKTLQQSKLANLARSIKLIEEHAADLGAFFTSDERGRRLPGYLLKLSSTLAGEQAAMNEELASLQRNVEHVRHVVQMQQSYAKGSTVREISAPSQIMEDALQMNLVSFERHNVRVVREISEFEPMLLDRHKVLQILVNLVSNAKDATKHNATGTREIRVKIAPAAPGRIRFEVGDNGTGIAPENMTRVFTHGFTTRKEGHGFGLHASANAAREMGGSLTGFSAGPGQGATFTLDVPVEARQSPVTMKDALEQSPDAKAAA